MIANLTFSASKSGYQISTCPYFEASLKEFEDPSNNQNNADDNQKLVYS